MKHALIINNQFDRFLQDSYEKTYPGGKLKANEICLPVIDTPAPAYDSSVEKVINEGYAIEGDQYVRKWRIVALSEYELAEKDWTHPEYEFRIICPKQLGEAYPAMYVHFQMEELPIEKHPLDSNLRVIYIDTVLQQHSDLLEELQDVVDLDARPAILTPPEEPIV